METQEKVVILHGFTNQEIHRLLPAIREAADKEKEIVFAMTTDTNLQWKVIDLIQEVTEEHKEMKKIKPKKQ
ncbi:DUF3783 domain-containing protein [Spirochaetia bacterium 38H-sp]|uniref:DUF3783 domain-containing protein n=1 Tax=Rarispira pelagica TaxID=3141764 RepID=A0ABU9UC28_9SPIR